LHANVQVPGSNAEVYPWILALGGTGIVVGLATYGYNSESQRCMLLLLHFALLEFFYILRADV
jgi:hypothetical protein